MNCLIIIGIYVLAIVIVCTFLAGCHKQNEIYDRNNIDFHFTDDDDEY